MNKPNRFKNVGGAEYVSPTLYVDDVTVERGFDGSLIEAPEFNEGGQGAENEL